MSETPSPDAARNVSDARPISDPSEDSAALPPDAAQRSEAHIGRLRAAMKKCALDTLCVRDTSDIFWLTCFDSVFDDERAHALFVDDGSVVLHTDSRYAQACREAAKGGPVAVDDEPMPAPKFAVRRFGAAAMRGAKTLGIQDVITLSEYRALQKAFDEALAEAHGTRDAISSDPERHAKALRETDGIVVGLRGVKDPWEIARMRAAQTITDAAFSHIVGFMKPGMTERDVQIELDDFMYRHGAPTLAFTSIVATGANGALPHAVPGDTPLEAGQCVVMDFGARAFGYCSDMTRTVFVGRPDAALADAYAVLRRANEEVEAALKPGMTGSEAHAMAERILAEGGYGGRMGHGLGHGVGIDIHEQPVLSPRNGKPLAIGNVVTVEPGIYIPGEFGMRLEDFGVIVDDGFEVFTRSTHDMVIV